MAKFAYEILISQDNPQVPGGVLWYLSSDTSKSLGYNLHLILNQLGEQGWEVVGIGDLGFDARSEVILKHKLSTF